MYAILAGLLPAAFLVYHIYKTDKLKPEPWAQLKRAIIFGICSIFVSMLISNPLESLGFYTTNYHNVSGAFRLALFGAAIPEELAKLLMLLLVVRNNPYFDEKMDGIVYSVCVGMGFAGFENVAYLQSAGDEWLGVGVARALLAVPCHYYCAVAMGFFFAKYRFERENRRNNMLWMIGMPILIHAVYDFLSMSMSITQSAKGAVILMPLLIYFCFRWLKLSRVRINQHLDDDSRNPDGYQKHERGSNDNYDRKDSAF